VNFISLYYIKRIRTKELTTTEKQSQSCKIKEVWVVKSYLSQGWGLNYYTDNINADSPFRNVFNLLVMKSCLQETRNKNNFVDKVS
jgi:Ni,Fe-hydrogenase I large subunit